MREVGTKRRRRRFVGLAGLLGVALTLSAWGNIWNPPPPIFVEPDWGVDQGCLDAC
ncbi:MAG: hypothetical protein ACP5VN_01450 [Acidobacteriota bacterium]